MMTKGGSRVVPWEDDETTRRSPTPTMTPTAGSRTITFRGQRNGSPQPDLAAESDTKLTVEEHDGAER